MGAEGWGQKGEKQRPGQWLQLKEAAAKCLEDGVTCLPKTRQHARETNQNKWAQLFPRAEEPGLRSGDSKALQGPAWGRVERGRDPPPGLLQGLGDPNAPGETAFQLPLGRLTSEPPPFTQPASRELPPPGLALQTALLHRRGVRTQGR